MVAGLALLHGLVLAGLVEHVVGAGEDLLLLLAVEEVGRVRQAAVHLVVDERHGGRPAVRAVPVHHLAGQGHGLGHVVELLLAVIRHG